MLDKKELGRRLRQFRSEMGMSRVALAKLARTSKGQIQKLEESSDAPPVEPKN